MPRTKLIGLITVGVLLLIVIWQSKVNPFGKFKSVATQPLIDNVKPRSSSLPVINTNSEFSDLQASISSILARLDALEAAAQNNGNPVNPELASPSPTAAAVVLFQPQSLYLGAASTTSREWSSTGLEVELNSADYPADVKAVFEAGLSIVGGEAWARLKNKTSGAIISVTEVMHNNGTVTWKNSGSFKLHTGNNIYSVELKSSSGETANLAGARLRLSR